MRGVLQQQGAADMIHIAVRVREIVSSNVDTLVTKTSNPAKMLRLLLSEIEESLIGLHGDLSKTKREHERTAQRADLTAKKAEEWTAKAKTAVDHKREDLARAALMAREDGRNQAVSLSQEVETLADGISELETAITELEAKREDVLARLKDMPSQEAASTCDAPDTKDSKTAKRMDRIDAMERRVNFGTEGRTDPKPTDIDAEIAALEQGSAIDAELAAMKKPAAKRTRKKAK